MLFNSFQFLIFFPVVTALYFALTPTHLRGRDLEYLQFKRDLSGFGKVYDYDVPSEWTIRRENYKDPVHFREPIAKMLIAEIWGANGGSH